MTDQDRIVHGTGVDSAGTYQVVRYATDRHWYIEYDDAAARGLPARRVRVKTAARLADEATLGLPGGKRFDQLWRGAPA